MAAMAVLPNSAVAALKDFDFPDGAVAPSPGTLIEIRALRVAAADWAATDPAQCRATIQTIFQNLRRGGFNVAFFQVREGAEVCFPSEREPWSRRLGGKDPGFDPLQTALAGGRENGIKVYAWVEAMSLGPVDPPPASTDSPHLFFTHGPEAKDSWVSRGADGRPAERDGEYFLNPAIPGVQAHARATVLEIARAYPNLDGLYITKLEYPRSDAGQDPVSVRRFHERGNPNLDDWDGWRRRQLTAFLIDLFAQVRAIRPTLVLAVEAPGIYSRSRFQGNAALPDGFHDRHADSKAWVEADAVDFVVPRVEEVVGAGGLTYHAIVEDTFDLYTEPRMAVGLDLGTFQLGTDAEEHARYPLRTGGFGIAGMSYASLVKADSWQLIRDSLFTSTVVPMPLGDEKRAAAGGLVVTVCDAAGKPIADATVKLDAAESAATSSGDGVAAFLRLKPGETKLRVEYSGAPAVETTVAIEAMKIAETSVRLDGVDAAPTVYLDILDPVDGSETTAAAANVLGHTWKAKSATVNGLKVPIYSTSLFVRDQIPLELGKNTLEAIVTGDDGTTARRTLTVTRLPEPTPTPLPPSFPLFIDEKSFQPAEETRLAPDEMFRLSFIGAPENIAEVRFPWSDWIRMDEETFPGTSQRTGRYSLNRAFTAREDVKAGNIEIRLRAPGDGPAPADAGEVVRSISYSPNTAIAIYGTERYRLLRVRDGETGHLLHGLHTVRLGGPYLAELPSRTLLHVTGRRGGFYRVDLGPDQEAWISIEEVENESPWTPPPHHSFTSIAVQGDETFDTITFPYSVHVPFRITPVVRPGAPAALEIDFFYTHDAATWISHRPTAKVVHAVTTEQIASGHLRVRADLRTPRIWGYKATVDGNSLRIAVRRPPAIAAAPESPLKGLTIGVEAGHGGSGSGAIGVSGTEEKTINRLTADALMSSLTEKGAKVVDCRIGDEAVELETRIRRAEEANADLFISIHANSASQARGYLRVSGTSTYYKWAFNHDFSEAIHARLLEKTGLGDFGNVGQFNYTPIRTTWMPAMLVEQAFMSNPEDEAKMLDPAFRQAMVDAIVDGTEDWLRAQRQQ